MLSKRNADYFATHLKVNNGTYFFDLQTPAGMINDIDGRDSGTCLISKMPLQLYQSLIVLEYLKK